MEQRENNPSFKEQLQRDWQALAVIAAIISVFIWMNTGSLITETERSGSGTHWGKHLIGEASSGMVSIILSVFAVRAFQLSPFSRDQFLRSAAIYLGMAIAFSFLHVSMMVGLRKIFWVILFESNYQFFGDVIRDSLYEFRKDAVTFSMFYLVYSFFRQSAEKKEASSITLKCGSTTIHLNPQEFLFAKSAGNYAELETLHSQQLVRATLKELEEELQEAGCEAVRIHRSYIVNREAISETSPIAGGDIALKLKSGHQLRASRRYKSALSKTA